MTTLISLIGTGQRDITGNAYQKTVYRLPNGKNAEPTAIFTGALIEYVKPQAVVILGTRTSAWAALIEEYRSDYVEIYVRLELGAKQAEGVDDLLLKETADSLQKAWGIPVACHAVCQRNIEENNAAEIMAACAAAFPRDGDVVLDVTHAFRSLAMLAQAAAHLLDAVRPGISARTKIMYGDLMVPPARKAIAATNGADYGQGNAIVLDALTKAAAFTNAMKSAYHGLDFEPLVSCIQHRELQKECSKVAVALRSLDLEILTSVIPKFMGHLHKSSDPLLKLVAGDLEELLRPFVGCRLDRALLILSQLAFKRGLWALSLFAAYEASCVYALNNTTVKNIKELELAWTAAIQQLVKDEKNKLQELAYARNQSAHGARRIEQKIRDPREVLENALPILNKLIPKSSSTKP